MAGVISADTSKCRCGGAWTKMTYGKYEVPVCEKCRKHPDKIRIRRVLPGIVGEPAKRIEIRHDQNNQKLTDVFVAISTMIAIDKEITDGTFDPQRYGSKETAQRLRFSYFVQNVYLPMCESKEKEGLLTKSSLRIKKGLATHHLIPFFKDTDLRNIRSGRILEFYHLSKITRQKILAVQELRVILSAAVDFELLQGIPKFPKLKQARMKSPDTFYTFEQQNLVLSKIKDPVYRDMIKLLARCMMRPCEVRALRQKDVDLFKKTLTVDEHFTQGTHLIDGRKGDHEVHILRLDDECLEMLQPYLTGEPDEPLFPGKKGEYVAERVLSRAWREAVAETNLPYIDLYTGTKSSTATELVRMGLSDRVIMSQSGHKTIDAFKRYGQQTQEDKLKDQDKILEFRRAMNE
jgi:integrase